MLTVSSRQNTDQPLAVDLLAATAERLHTAAQREGVSPATAGRLRRLADDLSSHALAARVLLSTGASPEAVERVLQRSIRLLEERADDVDDSLVG